MSNISQIQIGEKLYNLRDADAIKETYLSNWPSWNLYTFTTNGPSAAEIATTSGSGYSSAHIIQSIKFLLHKCKKTTLAIFDTWTWTTEHVSKATWFSFAMYKWPRPTSNHQDYIPENRTTARVEIFRVDHLNLRARGVWPVIIQDGVDGHLISNQFDFGIRPSAAATVRMSSRVHILSTENVGWSTAQDYKEGYQRIVRIGDVVTGEYSGTISFDDETNQFELPFIKPIP